MEFKPNPVTGNMEAQFQAKLLSIGTTVLQFNNVNKTEYVVGTIEFPNAEGELVSRQAICYKKVADKGMTIGNTYVATAVITPNQADPLLIVGGFTVAARATTDDFGGVTFVSLQEAAGVGAEELR